MRGSDLMAEGARQVFACPRCVAEEPVEGGDARRDALDEQLFGIGLHQRLHAAGDRFIATAMAKIVMCGMSAGGDMQQVIVGAAEPLMCQQNGATGGPNRQRCDGRLDGGSTECRIRIQRVDRCLDQLATAFSPDHDAGLDLPQLDHVRDLHDAVEDPQAGIRQVIDQAVGGKS